VRALAKPASLVHINENVGIETEPMTEKNLMIDKERVETAIALEITRFQRDSLKAQILQLSAQLRSATQRAERAEERLHETTIMISNLSMQAVATVRLSSVSEVFIEGRSVLRLLNPVGNFNQN